jgi:hypothetical protein
MGGNTLTSQFPANGSWNGVNITKDWYETLSYEKRAPDAVYKIQLPDADGVIWQAGNERLAPTWLVLPVTKQQTNCTIGADRVFAAGGKPFSITPITPDAFNYQLFELSKIPGSGITKIDSDRTQ